LCRSNTASKVWGREYDGARPDNKSRTGSTKIWRTNARNRDDAIPILLDSKPHGKGP
jgi:hypothetical protein